MTLLDEIRSRGHWNVTVRPASFQPERVPYAELQPILERAAVLFRGWDYPHISSRSQILRFADSIGQEVVFNHYHELWRFYRSGQFVHLAAMAEDWLQQYGAVKFPAGERLGIGHTLFRFTEIFEFAARLALSAAGDESMVIRVELVGLDKRMLWSDKNHPLGNVAYDDLVATIPRLAIEQTLLKTELVAKTWQLAASATHEVFMRFGWTDGVEVLQTEQEELRHMAERHGGLRH